MSKKILNNLDPQQKEAILAKSPIIINASAGSGKTRCLIAKIILLLEQGTNPENICAITFTNKAANEMKKRLKEQHGNIGKMQVSTIHSLCVGIIKNFTHHTVLEDHFSIYDDADQLSIIRTIIKSRELPGDPKTYNLAISHIKSTGTDNLKRAFRLSRFKKDLIENNFLLAYKTYQEILFKNNACDFDDLLIYANDCLIHNDCSDFYSRQWPHLLVDEFQDTSLIQYNIVNLLHTKSSKTLFVVGDFNQCVIENTNISGTPVEELSEGEIISVATGNGYTHNFFISEFYKKYVIDKDIITITTKSGRSLTTTAEHTHFAGYNKPYIKRLTHETNYRDFIIILGKKTKIKNNPLHECIIHTTNILDIEIFKENGLPYKKVKGSQIYEAKKSFYSLPEIYKIKENIEKNLSLNIIEYAKFANISLPMIPASHVLSGMTCFIDNNGKIEIDTIIFVKKGKYTGYVFDLNINQVHNFIANGIVTHNSIYAFRGAHPENIKDFIEKHNPTKCNLNFNYRSSPAIIKHANKYIQYGNQMIAKGSFKGSVSFSGFDTQEDEADKISNSIIRYGKYENVAILFRVNSRSLFFERAFANKHIPYKVVGALPYYKRRVSKDLLSYLKASTNRSDLESLVRIVNTPPRGFGAKKKELLLQKGWPYLREMADSIPRIKGLIRLLDEIKDEAPLNAVSLILSRTDYRMTIKKDNDRVMLSSFQDIIREFKTIEELVLASTFLEEDSGHGVKLLTAHSSKGLEFDLVFIVGVEERMWPHSYAEDIKEEERLFYVACTRARKYLNISYSKTRKQQGATIDSKPSNLFLESFKNHNS